MGAEELWGFVETKREREGVQEGQRSASGEHEVGGRNGLPAMVIAAGGRESRSERERQREKWPPAEFLRASLHYGEEVHRSIKNFSPRHGYLRQAGDD